MFLLNVIALWAGVISSGISFIKIEDNKINLCRFRAMHKEKEAEVENWTVFQQNRIDVKDNLIILNLACERFSRA